MVEEPRKTVISVKPQMVKGGLSLRLIAKWTKDLLLDFDAWNRDLMIIYREEFACPVHGYRHMQIYPPGKEPMKCFDAMVSKDDNSRGY